MRLITDTLNLPHTLNHGILRRHADQSTIRDRLLYLAKCWYSKSYENNAAQSDFIEKKNPILCKKNPTNTGRNTETIINLLFSSGSLAGMLTNYKLKNKTKTKTK